MHVRQKFNQATRVLFYRKFRASSHLCGATFALASRPPDRPSISPLPLASTRQLITRPISEKERESTNAGRTRIGGSGKEITNKATRRSLEVRISVRTFAFILP